MIDPEYYETISAGAEKTAEQLHSDIIRAIIKRILKRLSDNRPYILTQTDKWQIETLQDAGYLRRDIEKEIAKATGIQRKVIRKAFESTAIESMKYDDAIYKAAGLHPDPLKRSPYLIRLLQRGYEATIGKWINLTKTTADAAQTLFISECDRAYNLVSTRAESLTQAVAEAVERVSSDGVTITYPSGHVDTIETATQRAVRTGVAQACGDITKTRMDELGWDVVLVSAHLGARVTKNNDYTNHYWWQGKFYSKSGTDPRFPPFSVCGEGNVQGILGANCRHSYGPGDGEFNPYEHFDSKENLERYQNEQRQRAMERAIRKTKRELMGLHEALSNEEVVKAYNKKVDLINKQYKRYDAFCDEHGLKKLYDRANIAGWKTSYMKKVKAQ